MNMIFGLAFAWAAACFFLVIILDQVQVPSVLRKFAKTASSFSYTLYLVHYSILCILFYLCAQYLSPYLLFLFGMILSNCVAFFFASFTEKHYPTVSGHLKRLYAQAFGLRPSSH